MTKRRLMAISLSAILVVGILGAYAKYRLDLRPVATGSCTCSSITFTVASGENAPKIAQHLADAGLLRSRNAFVTFVNLHGLRPRLKVGSYSLTAKLSGQQIAEILADGRTTAKRLLVPEGFQLTQIEAAAVAEGIKPADLKAALAAPHAQSFLTGKPADVDLEGYLFPDSYQIDSSTTAASLVNAMLDNFAKRVGPEYTQAFAAEGLTLHQGLTLASMVEREVNSPADRSLVAGIFLRRYQAHQLLGSDVTAVYACKLLGVPFDVNVNSPYNTRRFVGLPPGPIASPGLASLDAVAHPTASDYQYFLTGKDGKTYFAKTYAEHKQNIADHL